MQDAGCLDNIEVTRDRGEFHDVGLRKLDVGDAKVLRHTFGIANAGAAKIDGEKARLRRLPGELDGDETCAAPGDEDVADVLRLTMSRMAGLAGGPAADQRG